MATNTIYIITNSINDKVYVGQTWNTLARRLAQHRYSGKGTCIKLQNAFAKYGKDKFSIQSIVTCDDQMTADYLEKFWIKTYDSIKLGYNIKEGGAHSLFTYETKTKISKALKGNKNGMGNKGGLGGAKMDYTNKTWKLINNKRVWMDK